MNELNLPPFYIGQRVVCIKSTGPSTILGKIYTVLDLQKSACCGQWEMFFGKSSDSGPFRYRQGCMDCGKETIDSDCRHFVLCKRFAPIHENFESITMKEVIKIEKPITCAN